MNDLIYVIGGWQTTTNYNAMKYQVSTNTWSSMSSPLMYSEKGDGAWVSSGKSFILFIVLLMVDTNHEKTIKFHTKKLQHPKQMRF